MGKFITNFETTEAYNAAEATLAKPNVSLTRDDMKVHYLTDTPTPTPTREGAFLRPTVDDYIKIVVDAEGRVVTDRSYYGYCIAINTDNNEVTFGLLEDYPLPESYGTIELQGEVSETYIDTLTISGVEYQFDINHSSVSPAINRPW